MHLHELLNIPIEDKTISPPEGLNNIFDAEGVVQ